MHREQPCALCVSGSDAQPAHPVAARVVDCEDVLPLRAEHGADLDEIPHGGLNVLVGSARGRDVRDGVVRAVWVGTCRLEGPRRLRTVVVLGARRRQGRRGEKVSSMTLKA